MLKSKKSVTFDQNEAKMFAAGVKRFMEAKELSVQELASRIKETPEYVENILEGNVAVGLEDVMDLSLALKVPINLLVYEYRYANGEDASVDIYNEMGNENEIDYDDEYISRAMQFIEECSEDECAHIAGMLSFVYDSYSQLDSGSVTLYYHEDEFMDTEDCIDCVTSFLSDISPRDRAFMVSAIELSIEQIRAGLGFSYIPFSVPEIDPQMFLMTSAIEHHYSGECSECQKAS